MATYSLQLLDFPGNYERGTLPYGPRGYIAIKTSSQVKSRNKSGKNETGFTVITPECVSATEFQHEIKRLIQELQSIEKQADRFFKKDMEKRKTMSSETT